MSKYKILLWDVDETLLNFKKSQEYALKACFAHFGRELTPQMLQRYDEINDSFWKRLERGEIDKKTLLPGRFLQLFTEFNIQGIAVEELQPLYQSELGSVYFYMEDSYELCRSLMGKYRQFVITNGVASTQRNKLRLSGFDRIMEDIFISEEIGAAKPSREFFDACLQKIKGCDKNSMLIIGDSLTSDMKGGNGGGIDTCWYNPKRITNDTDIVVTYEIHNLEEIKNILDC